MTETNLNIVKPGAGLYLRTRVVEVEALNPTPRLLEVLCKRLRTDRGLIAVRHGENALLIASEHLFASVSLEGSDWVAALKDAGALTLRFCNLADQRAMAQLIERQLLHAVASRTDLWNYGSPRHWYEPVPFKRVQDVDAYRRFEISVLPVEKVGIGISVAVGTAFFTNRTVADYFDRSLPGPEYRRRQRRFDQLSQRQIEQRGTLLYDAGKSYQTAYFARFAQKTCGAISPLKVKGVRYASLHDYYQTNGSMLDVSPADGVAYVSFGGNAIKGPQPVAAKQLRLRVFTDALPNALRTVSQLKPHIREKEAAQLWAKLGANPLGGIAPGIRIDYWRPNKDAFLRLNFPDLLFHGGAVLKGPPMPVDAQAIRTYHRRKLDLLNQHGCWYVPLTLPRLVYQAVPESISDALAQKHAAAIEARLKRWTRINVKVKTVCYKTLEDAFQQLRTPGVRESLVVFVFQEASSLTYATIAQELTGWRVKRVKDVTLNEQEREAASAWSSFVDMTCLDLLQELGCAPWGFATKQPFDAALVIDVGQNKETFALSLMLTRNDFAFRLETATYSKADTRKETIHPKVLGNAVIDLFRRADIEPSDLIDSLLVLRDGRLCGEELEALKGAVRTELVKEKFLNPNGEVTAVEVRKQTQNGIRAWRRDNGRIETELENTAFKLDSGSAVLLTTGAPTTHQGTPVPLLVTAVEPSTGLTRVVQAISSMTQLNWSSPKVAQRYPQPLKRTDDALKVTYQLAIKRLG